MKAELIIPIDKLRGMLRKDGFYFRMYRGQQIAQDRAAFNAQKDEPGGCKTLKQYLWKVCGDAYDQQHG